MNSNEKLEIWKKRIVDLGREIRSLEENNAILNNISSEVKTKQNPKLEILLEWIDLEDEISYINDWIDYHKDEISKYKIKIDELQKEKEQQSLEETKKQVKLLFEPKEGKKPFRAFSLLNKDYLARYAAPVLISLLIMSILLVAKPGITGQVVLNKETAYVDDLNLIINESGTYEWNMKNPSNIRSVKASGSVTGNGTVKIYIEKDGKLYLIFNNVKS